MAALIAGSILGGGLINAGGSLLGANAASDARNQALSDAKGQLNTLTGQATGGTFLGNYGTSDIFGSVPDAALYNPVSDIDWTKSQRDTINGNLVNFGAASKLAGATNSFNLDQSLNRINTLVPNYQTNLNSMGNVTRDLLLGKLPYSDTMDITGNRSSLSASMGVPGGATNATLKDLGLSQLSAEQSGANMFQQMLTGAQQVMPTSAMTSPSSMFLDPTTRAQLDLSQRGQNIEQAQLEQQSSQSANNLAASADPAAASLFNLSASMIPATLGVSTSGNLGGGIANAGSAVGNSLSQLGTITALQNRANQTSYSGGYNTSQIYPSSGGTSFTMDANGNLMPTTIPQGYVNPNATF